MKEKRGKRQNGKEQGKNKKEEERVVETLAAVLGQEGTRTMDFGQDPREVLIRRVIGALIEVHKEIGPGFLEQVYHRAVEIELGCRGIWFETEKEILLHYKGKPIGSHKLDLFVEGILAIELKTVEELHSHHYAQVRSYLKAVHQPIGLLVNFSHFPLDVRRVEPNHHDN